MIVAKRRVIRCSVECHHSGRAFVVRIDEGARSVSIKLKGLRTWFRIPTKQLYTVGGWNAAAAIKAEKKRLREENKKANRV